MTDHIVATNFIMEDYLKRINSDEYPVANIDSIKKMVQAHLFNIPFENLDVQAGKIVSLEPDDIINKIIYQNRGGYCYEVNGLLALALQTLKIPYIFVAARPLYYPVKRPKTHLVIIATIEGEKYLIDVGFGSYCLREPLNIKNLETEVLQGKEKFRLKKNLENEYLLEAFAENAEWKNQFSFELYHQEWIDFAPANFLNSRHPDAVFVQKPFVVSHNHFGKKVLFGDTLTTYTNGIPNKYCFEIHEYENVLSTEFGLSLNKLK